MRKSIQTAIVLTIGIVLVVMLATGCEEQSLTSTRKSKLIANENRQLKEQLVRRDRKIESLRNQLQECLKEKKYLEEDTQKNMEEMIGRNYNILMEKTEKAEGEHKKLKLEIEELKKQLENKEEPKF